MRWRATLVTTLVVSTGLAATAQAAAPDAGTLLGWGQLPGRAALGLGSEYATPGPIVLPAGAAPVATAAVAPPVVLTVSRAGVLYAEGQAWATGAGAAQTDTTIVGPRVLSLPAATAPVVAVAASENAGYALTAAGELYGWGVNATGELGLNAGSYYGVPIRIQLPLSAGKIVRISAGVRHAAAVTDSGQVWAWGGDEAGQTGQPVATSTLPQRVTAGNLGDEQVVDVVAGDDDTLVQTAAGRVWGFGNNASGQLGTLPSGGGAHPQPTPAPIALSLPPDSREPTVTAIAAGARHALAIADGTVYSWGHQGPGALGRPISGANAEPGTVALPADASAPVAVAAASVQSFVTTATGQAYGFGASDIGQLGNPGLPYGSEVGTATPTPVAVPAPTTLSRVFAGDSVHSSYFGGATLGLVSNLAIAPQALTATAGRPLSATLTATGGDGPYAWGAAGLPAWLTLDRDTGALHGTPPAASAATFAVTVTDRFGTVASRAMTVTVAPAPAVPAPGDAGTTSGPGGGARVVTPSRVRIVALTHTGGSVKVRLSCAGGACTGTLALTRRSKRKTITYARKSYALKSGTARTLTVTINKAGAAKLRTSHRLALTLALKPAAGGRGAVSRRVTLKPAAPKTRHRRR